MKPTLEWQKQLRKLIEEKDFHQVNNFMLLAAVLDVDEIQIRLVMEETIKGNHDLEHYWLEEDCPCMTAHLN